jgi:hypothetical protein
MATKFAKDQELRLTLLCHKALSSKLRMDEDGNFFYMIEWVDGSGQAQSRWFAESELTEV